MIDCVVEISIRICLTNLVVDARSVEIGCYHIPIAIKILNYILAVVDKVQHVMAVLAPLNSTAKGIVFVSDSIENRTRVRANARNRQQRLSETILKVISVV